MNRVALALALLTATTAQAADLSILERFHDEPSVRELQQAATRQAELQPERVQSWLKRAGKAAILPTVRLRAGRGYDAYVSDSAELSNSDNWRFEAEATWQLDRLVFDRNVLRASREAQRVAARREELGVRIAQLYFERRRLQVDALMTPDAPTALERAIEIEELTAVIDGLTGGALTRKKTGP